MNGDQEIEREEFKHVGLILLSNQKFREVDTDGNGTLDPEEFKAALLQLNYEPHQVCFTPFKRKSFSAILS